MFLNQALMFPNAKDDLPQLFLKDVKGQFTYAKTYLSAVCLKAMMFFSMYIKDYVETSWNFFLFFISLYLCLNDQQSGDWHSTSICLNILGYNTLSCFELLYFHPQLALLPLL